MKVFQIKVESDNQDNFTVYLNKPTGSIPLSKYEIIEKDLDELLDEYFIYLNTSGSIVNKQFSIEMNHKTPSGLNW